LGPAALLIAAGLAPLAAQQPDSARPGGPPDPAAMHARMQAHAMRMDSLDARLDTLTARMNRATGNARIAAMADVINELVAQRRTMHRQMHEMMMHMPGMGPMAPMQPRRGPPPGRPGPADTGKAAKPAPGAT
jgi:hypothetical protein